MKTFQLYKSTVGLIIVEFTVRKKYSANNISKKRRHSVCEADDVNAQEMIDKAVARFHSKGYVQIGRDYNKFYV